MICSPCLSQARPGAIGNHYVTAVSAARASADRGLYRRRLDNDPMQPRNSTIQYIIKQARERWRREVGAVKPKSLALRNAKRFTRPKNGF